MTAEDLLRHKLERAEHEIIAVRAENLSLRLRLQEARIEAMLAREFLAFKGYEVLP
jgi:hypothetical protein